MNMVKLAFQLLLRNIRWLWTRMSSKNNEIIREIHGQRMILLTSRKGIDLKEKNIHKQLALDGIREIESTKIIKSLLKPGDVVLEIGANIGYYALLESRLVGPTGWIYAIEPESGNFQLLERNIRLNGLTNVETFRLAVGDQDGESQLYISENPNHHSLVSPGEARPAASTETVRMQTVDSFLTGKRPVRFLRMDIEGFEYETLKGMKNTLQQKGISMFIELHSNILKPEQCTWILEEIKKNGFELTAVISHDKFIQRALGHMKVERMTIDQFIRDPRLRAGTMGFLLFFEKSAR